MEKNKTKYRLQITGVKTLTDWDTRWSNPRSQYLGKKSYITVKWYFVGQNISKENKRTILYNTIIKSIVTYNVATERKNSESVWGNEHGHLAKKESRMERITNNRVR